MDHRIEWRIIVNGPPRIEFWAALREPGNDFGFRALQAMQGNMAARTPDSGAGGEDGQGAAQGSGEPQQILRACAESLLTAVARLEGERPVGNPAQPSVISGASTSTALSEHRRLFGYQTPTSSRSGRPGTFKRGQGQSKKRVITTKTGECLVVPVKNTWTKLFVCLSLTSNNEVPTTSEKINLSFAGLGEKKVVFDKDGKATHVYEKLVAEYPLLAEGGGFEVLRTTANSSKMLTPLPVPPGGYTVPYLKSVLGQARGFIRPLQTNLKLQPHVAAFQVR